MKSLSRIKRAFWIEDLFQKSLTKHKEDRWKSIDTWSEETKRLFRIKIVSDRLVSKFFRKSRGESY